MAQAQKEGKYYERDPKTGQVRGVPIGDEPMAEKVIGCRFPVDVDQWLRQLPNKSEYVRRVVTAAVREDMEKEKSNG